MQFAMQRHLQLIWSWSLGGLPKWLILPGLMTAWSRRLDVKAIEDIPKITPAGQLVDVYIDDGLLLIQKMTVPLVARGSLGKIVDLHLRQSLPQKGKSLLWTYTVEGRKGNSLDILVFLFRKKDLQGIEETLKTVGSTLRIVRVARAPHSTPLEDNRQKTDGPLKFWGAIAFLLALGVIAVSVWQHQREMAWFDEEISRLQNIATSLSDEMVSLRTSIATTKESSDSVHHDLSFFATEHARLPILLDLSDTLTDETWISEFHLFGTELRVSGFTEGSVANVIDQISTLPWASAVALDGLALFDRSERMSRFNLIARLLPRELHQ